MVHDAFSDGAQPPDERPPAPLDRMLDAAFGFVDGGWARLAARALQSSGPMGSLGGYALLEELGRGGQGSVYKAVQPGTGRLVAIKRLGSAVLLGERQNERFRERYRAEIEALTRLRHPSIVTVHAAEVLDGHPVLVMEYVEGESIDRWADRQWAEAADPIDAILAAFVRVCDGVSHAHQRGVIHRDIKPTNILVERQPVGGAPAVKVLDFGIAQLLDGWEDAGLATTSGFAGTPAYASPEQLASRKRGLDTRSDVYSLGVLLCRLLGGREPWPPDAPVAEILAAIGRGGGCRPSSGRPGLPRELDLIVGKATRVEAAERYQSVDALKDDVDRFQNGRPIAAHPPGRRYLLGKFVRRHRAACAAGALAAAAIVGLAAVSTVQAVRLSARSRDLADALRIQKEAAAAIERARARAEAQERVAVEEGERQRRTAAFLLALVENIASSSEGRATIPIEQLAQWIDAPLSRADGLVDRETLARLHLGLATIFSAAQQRERAEKHDEAAIALLRRPEDAPLRAQALIQSSMHRRYRGPQRPALTAAHQALAAVAEAGLAGRPVEVAALRQLSLALARAGRQEESLAALEQALEIAERNNHPAATRSQILADLASRHYHAGADEACVEYCHAALACVPIEEHASTEGCWRAMVTRGTAAFRRGDIEEAERCFALTSGWQRRALGDGHIRARNAMRWHARALHELGRYEEAAAIFERLIQLIPPHYETLDPGTWQTRFRYSATLYGVGRPEEADRQLRLAVSRSGARTPRDLDAEIDRAKACLLGNNLRFSAELRQELGDLAWLVDFVSGQEDEGEPGGG